MKSRRIVSLASLFGMLALTGCGGGDETGEMGAESGAETAPSTVTTPATPPPAPMDTGAGGMGAAPTDTAQH